MSLQSGPREENGERSDASDDRVKADFFDAAKRHREDADCLYARGRLANADQLYGFGAECALKAIMEALGMPVRPDGAPGESRHRVHIDRLWREFAAFSEGRVPGRYVSAFLDKNPFDDWNVCQRYWPSQAISEKTVECHRVGCQQVFGVLFEVKMDGWCR